MFAQLEIFACQSNRLPPREALFAPPRVPLVGLRWMNEELDFHLFKFTAAEGEIARSDFVAKGLADLCDAEWNSNARAVDHVFEVGEDALRGFWSQICDV